MNFNNNISILILTMDCGIKCNEGRAASEWHRPAVDHTQGTFLSAAYPFPQTVSLKIFVRNSNSMESSRCSNSFAGRQIATIFAHATTSVVPCTKFCSDHGMCRCERETKFPSNLKCDGRTVSETGPWLRYSAFIDFSASYYCGPEITLDWARKHCADYIPNRHTVCHVWSIFYA